MRRRILLCATLLLLAAGISAADPLAQGFESGLGDWRITPLAGDVPCGVVSLPYWIHSGSHAFMAGPTGCDVNCLDTSAVALEIDLHAWVETLRYWILEDNVLGATFPADQPWFGESTQVTVDGAPLPEAAFYPPTTDAWHLVEVPINAFVGTLGLVFWDMSSSGSLFLDDISITFATPPVTPGGSFEETPVPRFCSGPGGGSVDTQQLWMGIWGNGALSESDTLVFDQSLLEWRAFSPWEETEQPWVACLSETTGLYALPADSRVIEAALDEEPEAWVFLRDQPGAAVTAFRPDSVIPDVHAGSRGFLPGVHFLLLR